MIRFRSTTHKIIFFVIIPIITIGTLVLLYYNFKQPVERGDPTICICPMMCSLPVVFLIFLITFFFSEPSEEKSTSLFWPLILSCLFFLCFMIFGYVQFTKQKGARCSELNPDAILWSCNFFGDNLSNLDLSRADLSNANLSKANLTGVKFISANLTNANLSGADLNGANFSGANLTNANLSGADLTNVSFESVVLDKADLAEAIGLTNDILSELASWRGVIIENRLNIYANLAPACRGEGVSSAAPFTKDNVVHSLVLLDRDGNKHKQSDNLPLEWWPPFTSYTQLVACADPETEVLIQTCGYTGGGKARRYVKEVVVRIVEASTGELVNEVVVRGSEPRQCPRKLTSYGSSPVREYRGSSPSSWDYKEELSKFVNADGEVESLRIPSSD